MKRPCGFLWFPAGLVVAVLAGAVRSGVIPEALELREWPADAVPEVEEAAVMVTLADPNIIWRDRWPV
jgi:hypothetical protein